MKALEIIRSALLVGEGGPIKVIVAGDQLSYVLMKKAIQKFTDRYDWVVPFPGDAHFQSNYGEAICKRYGEMFLRQFAERIGLSADPASQGKLGWSSTHAFLWQAWFAVFNNFVMCFVDSKIGCQRWLENLSDSKASLGLNRLLKSCVDNPFELLAFCKESAEKSENMKLMFEFCFETMLPYLGIWLASGFAYVFVSYVRSLLLCIQSFQIRSVGSRAPL
jgi:hypothetical protein